MSYQPGSATSAAATTGNIYLVAAAAAVDMFASFKAEEESAEQARALRDSQVKQQAYSNTAANAQLQTRQEQVTRENFEAQLRALETTSAVNNADRGLSSAGLSRVAQKYTRQFQDVIQQNASSMRAIETEHRMRAKAGELNLADRINSIPIYKADAAGTLVNAGLTIHGMKQKQGQLDQYEARLSRLEAGAQKVEI